MAILAAIGSALFTAIISIYLKRIFKESSTKQLAPLNFGLSSVIMLVFVPYYFYFQFTPMAVIYLVTVCVLDTIANYFYYSAIENNQVSYASIFMSLSPIFTLFFFTFFIGTISLTTLVSAFGIMISIYILNLDYKTNLYDPFLNIFRNKNYLGLVYAFVSGLTALFIKQIFAKGYINAPTLYLLRDVFIFGSFCIMLKPKISDFNEKTVSAMYVRSLLAISSILLYFYAISIGHVVTVTIVSSIYPAFILIISYFLFKEKISYQKAAAILSILFFIAILNYSIDN